jgi:transcriptional regulator with XRE-family HTH domain
MLMFASNVKYLRESKGLKQADMLGTLGIKQSTWNGYEKGISTPTLNQLIAISDFFGISEGDILHQDLTNTHLIDKNEGGKNKVNAHLNTPGNAHLNYKNQQKALSVQEPVSSYGIASKELENCHQRLADKEETIRA